MIPEPIIFAFAAIAAVIVTRKGVSRAKEIHTLVNSNLAAIKAELAIVLATIRKLEAFIVSNSPVTTDVKPKG